MATDIVTATVFEPAEIGRGVNRSAATVKRIAAEAGIEPLRTQRGARLFTSEQVARIKAEIERRAREAGRLAAVAMVFLATTAFGQVTPHPPMWRAGGVSPQQVSNIVAGMTGNFATLAQVGNAVLGSMSVFAPTNLVPPTISGDIVTGSTVTASTGVWFSALPAQGVWCQWLKDGSGIPDETNVSYAIGSNDLGSVLAFRVTITNALGQAIATSATTAAVTNAPAGGGATWHLAGGQPWGLGSSPPECSGYQVGDQVTLTLPNAITQAVLQIVSVDGNGYPTGVTLVYGGSYTSYPGDNGQCDVTGGSGSGGIFNWVASSSWQQ